MWFSWPPPPLVAPWHVFSTHWACHLRQPPSWCSTRTLRCRFPARSPSMSNARCGRTLPAASHSGTRRRRSSEWWARAAFTASSRPTGATCARATARGSRRRRRGPPSAAPTPPLPTTSTSTSRWHSRAPRRSHESSSSSTRRPNPRSVWSSLSTNCSHSLPTRNEFEPKGSNQF